MITRPSPLALSLGALLIATPLSACLESQPGAQVNDTSSASDTRASTGQHDTGSTTTTAEPDTASTATSAPDSQATTAVDTSEDTVSCDPVGTPCMFSSGCCEGDFCAGGPYFYGECTPKQPIGQPCHNDDYCTSGHCSEGVCAVEGCGVEGSDCQDDTGCCGGWCESATYAPPVCRARLPLGETCYGEHMCRSGLCVDNRCVAACQAEDDGCLYDNDCCDGTYCADAFTGGSEVGTCQPKLAAGAECPWDGVCESGFCREGRCTEVGCLTAETECYSDGECCTGACSYDNFTSYAPGLCIVPQPVDVACRRDAWCKSQHCVEGVCKN